MKILREYIDLIKEAQAPEWKATVAREVAARGLPEKVSGPGYMNREETWSYGDEYFGKSSETVNSDIFASEEYGSYENEDELDNVITAFLSNDVSDILVDYDTDEQERTNWQWEGANSKDVEAQILKKHGADSVFEFVENILPGHDDYEADYFVDGNIANIQWSDLQIVYKQIGNEVKMTYSNGNLTPSTEPTKPAPSNPAPQRPDADGTDYSLSGE